MTAIQSDRFVFQDIENATDHYFLNSAYLSELWAAEDLKAKRRTGRFSGEALDAQISDEERHARMLRNIMIDQGYHPIENVDFAMQNVIYKRICKVDLSSFGDDDPSFWGMHNIMERRALWNYRTYLRGGRVSIYKEVLKKIIKDEVGHLKEVPENARVLQLASLDYWVYRNHLAYFYNRMNLIQCQQFWQDYFTDQLVAAPE